MNRERFNRKLVVLSRLQMELEWLHKNTRPSVAERRALIEPQHPQLSVHRQCQLLGPPRSFYYRPVAADRLTSS